MASDAARPSLVERIVDRIPFLEKELFLLRKLVRPGDVCLDVGAAGGAHLLVMARRAGRGGRVLGFEPRPNSLRVVRWLVALAGVRSQVTLLGVALSDRRGRLSLRVPVVPTRAHFHGSVLERDRAAAFPGMPYREIDVVTRTLDEVVEVAQLDRVDLVKCDVEGAELLVFAGAGRVLRQFRPVVVVEADDLHQRRFDATAQDVIDAVVAHDYEPYRFRRGLLERVGGVVPDEDDYVLVPRERLLPDGLLRGDPPGEASSGNGLRH